MKNKYQAFQIASKKDKKNKPVWREISSGKIKVKEEKKGLHLRLDKNTLKNIKSSNNQNYILYWKRVCLKHRLQDHLILQTL